MDMDLFSQYPRASRKINGVLCAKVCDSDDPQHLGRVKVKFDSISENSLEYWARMAVPMAGNERGVYFMPQVGDEVLIAFEDGDIDHPYVIGALWNSSDKPPVTGDKDNNIREVKSRSGHVVRFDDTDGSEKIEIIDKSGKNAILFDTANNTITIKSEQDISIEAPNGSLKLSAKNIEISSTSDTQIKGQGGVGVDGSPGNTEIKGTTVNIN